MTTVAAPADCGSRATALGDGDILTARGRIDHETAPRLAWVFGARAE